MNQQEKQKLSNDIEALIFLSDKLAMAFDFKAKELRDMFQEEISQYNEFKELLCGKPLDIIFEMKYLNGTWTISIPGCPDFDTRTIPGEIITQITENTFKPGIINMLKDFETEEGRKFDINFEKTSNDAISGAIKEKREYFTPFNDLQNTSKAERKKKMNELYEFHRFLLDNEKFYNWFMVQYKDIWKPLIENEGIQTLINS
jgi:hypothetical protein